jgi:hypothetical protein
MLRRILLSLTRKKTMSIQHPLIVRRKKKRLMVRKKKRIPRKMKIIMMMSPQSPILVTCMPLQLQKLRSPRRIPRMMPKMLLRGRGKIQMLPE